MSNVNEEQVHNEEEFNGEERMEWTVAAEHKKERVDKYITDALEDVSRSQVQLWIGDGAVTVNGAIVKANAKLSEGDQIVLHIPGKQLWKLSQRISRSKWCMKTVTSLLLTNSADLLCIQHQVIRQARL